MIRCLLSSLLALGLLLPVLAGAQPVLVEEDWAWTDVFARNPGIGYGWAGADGVYSIPLNRNDQPGSYQTTPTLMLFSDTIYGAVDSSGWRHGAHMVNNTMALLPPGGPNEEATRFISGTHPQRRQPRSVFLPDTPNTLPGDYYWLGDGLVLDGEVWITANRMYQPDGGGFARRGMALLSMPLDAALPLEGQYYQKEMPNYFPAEGDRGDISHAVTYLDNTAAAGAPHPDGYIYLYGLEEVWLNKFVLAARVTPDDFPDFNAWRYWNGMTWVEDPLEAIRIAERVSSGYSVTPLPDGRFLMVFQLDTISDKVAVRVAPSPVGPWSDYLEVYDCPQADSLGGAIVTYNAKAHPHLSDPGELLVSFNVNGGTFGQNFGMVDIYRPRFLRLSQAGVMAALDGSREMTPAVSINLAPSVYPNPFNASATVQVDLPRAMPLAVTVVDITGRLVATLHDGHLSAGRHVLSLDGARLASGTYFVRTVSPAGQDARRITVVK